MPVIGPLSHIDLSVSDPGRSIPFYQAFFESIGFTRWPSDESDFAGERRRETRSSAATVKRTG